MAHAVLRTQGLVAAGELSPDDVTAETLEQHLYTQVCSYTVAHLDQTPA